MSIDAKSYYEKIASEYSQQYQLSLLQEGIKYPQNYYRLQWLVERVGNSGIKNIFEVGTGEGTPLATLSKMGIEVAGCDMAANMVSETRRRFEALGLDQNRVQIANIEDAITLAPMRSLGLFDALFAFGVMPHVSNDLLCLRNMKMMVKDGGKIFIEFRNKLFSLFTMNRLTKEFILDDLLSGVSGKIKEEVEKELDKRLAIEEPPMNGSGYGQVMNAKFHNPFEIQDLFQKEGFRDIQTHWYHYHAAPPIIEKKLHDKTLAWKDAAAMENQPSWKGYFLCSAFVIAATVSK